MISILIAQWRAKDIIEAKEREDMAEDIKNDAYIQMRDMLSLLKIENGLIIQPEEETDIIALYENPERLREKFRSRTLDTLLMVEFARFDYEHE